MSDRTTDEPLDNPESDLLGLAPHAQTLAGMIRKVPTPFTIGVYGEWGAGKTTFALFVKEYLEIAEQKDPEAQEVDFIRFEAWPHKTADELWRALIIRIAARLYDQPDKREPAAEAPTTQPTWGAWLGRKAIVLREAEVEKTDETEYLKLLEKLDGTLYGGIGKSGAARWRVDQEQVLVSAVKAGFTALGAASPLVAGLRGLFNLDGGETSGAAQREQNEETRARIESIDKFRAVLDDLLKTRGTKDGRERRLCIFLDDLDRCTPDVALDLLDAIKVFLAHARFVFVIAADEEIIGRGLRMRYRDLAQLDPNPGTVADRLAREGQQYFEKIVQLRIHIPEAGPKEAHRFIAAQFPEWMPATDIMYAALGSNPRRVKQYCNWMMYRHEVEQPLSKTGTLANSEEDAALLNKMIALFARSEECFRDIAALAVSGAYTAKMKALEDHVDALGEDPPDAKLKKRVTDASLIPLCERICALHPLFNLFREKKRFSEFPALKVETFAAIADLHPRADTMLEANDRVFMRILQLTKTGSISTQNLVIDDFSRLRALELHAPKLLPKVHALAESARLTWAGKMLEIETELQAGKAGENLTDVKMKDVMAAINEIPIVADSPLDRRTLLLKTPRLSEMLREVVLGYCTVRENLPAASDLLSKRVADQASDDQKTLSVAKHAYASLRPDVRAGIEQCIELRKWAASHCLWMRSFAKLNALDRCWPELARHLRRDFNALRAFENEVVSPGSMETQYMGLWEEYRSNNQLRSFLALQPLFGQIDPSQLQKYLSLSQAIAPSAEVMAPAASPPPPPAAPTDGAIVSEPQRDQSEYVNLRLLFEDAPPDAQGSSNYRITFQAEHGNLFVGNSKIDWKDIEDQHAILRKANAANPYSAGPTRQFGGSFPLISQLNELASLGDYTAFLRELGASTLENIFPGELLKELERLLGAEQRYRILFEGPNEVMSLPFETLYSRRLRSFLALTQKFSLVRWRSLPTPMRRLPLTLPLRILVVLANPKDSAPLNLEGEEEVLMRAISPAIEAGRVSLTVIGRGGATWERVNEVVKSFRPHVFHFMGHGVFGAEGPGTEMRGSLVLDDANGQSHFLAAPEFATLLGGQQIQIAVLNGCDTGTAARNEAISSLADALTNSGVPAVIATMREVADDTALLFTREFYRALCEGQALESAMAEARKALSVERRDWSVYALFASMMQLDVLKIAHAVQQRGGNLNPPP